MSVESTEESLQSCNNNSTCESENSTHSKVLGKYINKGDLLLTSVPFAYVLKGNLRGQHCDSCLRKRPGLQRCSGCASCYYCNRECQKNSWEIHKKECSKLKKLKNNLPPDTARLIARVILKLKDGGGEIEEKIDNSWSRKFEDLMNHSSEVKEDISRQEHFHFIYLGEENLPSSSELFEIYGKVLVNSFSITDKDLNSVGIGIYLAASIIDHSCKPNAYASFIGTQVYIRALYDMPELDWKKIRISYIDVLNTAKKRNEELERGYFFACSCVHCQNIEREKVMSSIVCGNPNCLSPIYIDNDEESVEEPVNKCSSCGFSDFEMSTKEKYFEILNVTKRKLEMKKDFETLKELVEKQSGLFHNLNLWHVKTLDATFESAINSGSWEVALTYGCRNLIGIKYYYGSNHPMYGLYLLKLGKIELYLFKFREALEHLEEAEPILRVSHGLEHLLYADDLAPLVKQARQEIKMMQHSGFKVKKIQKNEIKGII
ncbi:Histone-lysine N-methyltransferase SMYD3 [Armadillidium vulgare]|nr:Histone-lysine N-methyltransferase SMYD3 [Armadillidium vulgare]